jgi:hypothetical protein
VSSGLVGGDVDDEVVFFLDLFVTLLFILDARRGRGGFDGRGGGTSFCCVGSAATVVVAVVEESRPTTVTSSRAGGNGTVGRYDMSCLPEFIGRNWRAGSSSRYRFCLGLVDVNISSLSYS